MIDMNRIEDLLKRDGASAFHHESIVSQMDMLGKVAVDFRMQSHLV